MKQFSDKVVIITGSSMGIGKALARQLLEQGAKVTLNGRDKDRLKATAEDLTSKGYQVLPIDGDVSKLDDCQKIIRETMAHFGRIDLLVNNAGVNMRSRIEDTDPAALGLLMGINFMGPLYLSRLALQEIRKNCGGILFVSSVAGIHGLPLHGLYSASKMALLPLAESLKAELSGSGVYIGIAYVGITENEPGKTIYNADGTKTPKETIAFMGVQPIEKVASGMVRMIRNRTFKKVFSPIGKVNALLNRVSPAFVQYVLTRAYKQQEGKW